MNIRWVLKKFSTLSPDELYSIIRLRNEVFVVEQNCVFQDADNKDQLSHHLMGWADNMLLAYTRIVPPGIIYELPSIGRVVTSYEVRRTGLGRELMQKSLEEIQNLYGKTPVKIGAQLYLKNFYESLGFKVVGEIYLEDNIEHIQMVFTENKS